MSYKGFSLSSSTRNDALKESSSSVGLGTDLSLTQTRKLVVRPPEGMQKDGLSGERSITKVSSTEGRKGLQDQ